MPTKSNALGDALDSACPIARTMGVLSDPWSFLLIREALLGRRRFAEFREQLGIATDVLSARLATLVDHGILTKAPYKESGQRTRHSYALTPAGEELKLVVAALQQWGDEYLPSQKPLKARPMTREPRRDVRVGFSESSGAVVDSDLVEFVPVPGLSDDATSTSLATRRAARLTRKNSDNAFT